MKRLERKHPLAVRWLHWINFPLLFLMIWRGILFEPCDFRFEFGYSLIKGRGDDFDFFDCEARCDVLRAIPVEGFDMKNHQTLDFRFIIRHGEFFR